MDNIMEIIIYVFNRQGNDLVDWKINFILEDDTPFNTSCLRRDFGLTLASKFGLYFTGKIYELSK